MNGGEGMKAPSKRDAAYPVTIAPVDDLVHWSGSGLLGHQTACGHVDRGHSTEPTDRKVDCKGCLSVEAQFRTPKA